MKTTILYDETGVIIAMSKVGAPTEARGKFGEFRMVPRPGQKLIEVELSSEDEKRPLLELYKAYRVDVVTSKLVKK